MRKIWGAAGLAALALAVSACGSSASSTAGTANTPAAGGSSSPAASTTINERTIGGQQVLTNSQGYTLYWFALDTSATSKCTGSCATFWPPVKGPATAGSGVTGTLGTITRTDGSTQATYDGHPLYTYSGDKAPGENKGNGLNLSGGLWYEMTASGSTPGPAASSGSSSSSGGYGY